MEDALATTAGQTCDGDLIIFLHMHKCAGSAVVKHAIDNGFTLPLGHLNGNIMVSQTEPQLFGNLTEYEIRQIVERQIISGVNFMAIEWDFPRFEHFPRDIKISFFTVLRNPLIRAVSNYRMDKLNGWFPASGSFRDYLNGSGLYRAHNYFVKKLGNIGSSQSVCSMDVHYACSVLRQFDGVFILERDGIGPALSRFGMSVSSPDFVNDFQSSPLRLDFEDERLLTVSEDDMLWFCENNAGDNYLYFMFNS